MTEPLPDVLLVDVDAANWRAVAAVAPRPDQEQYVAPVTYYLCLGHYGGDWHSLGIQVGETVVGHVMWAVDEADGYVWLGGLLIDAAAQGRGYGKAAASAFLDRFLSGESSGVALSYDAENAAARSLYLSLGFVETGEKEGSEVVARYQRPS